MPTPPPEARETEGASGPLCYVGGRMAMVLNGKPVAAKVQAEVRTGVAQLRAATGVTPTLAVILVGDFPPSRVYIRNKKVACAEVGIATQDHLFPSGLSEADLLQLIQRLNDDPAIHGILLQLPLLPGMDEDRVIEAIATKKDVDGFHPENLGRLLAGTPTVVPCTPAGVLEILDHYGIELKGQEAVVIGRSRIVGKPLAHLLLARHATVTLCHSRTQDIAFHTRRADLLAVAVGKAGVVTGDMVKEGSVVIDVGINRGADGKLTGDVEFAGASARARAITPVPGGVGPMTVAMLMKNTFLVAKRQLGMT